MWGERWQGGLGGEPLRLGNVSRPAKMLFLLMVRMTQYLFPFAVFTFFYYFFLDKNRFQLL